MNVSPIYVGQKAKRLLQWAVWNDATFLNSVKFMDYSLLVVVDRQRREIVCGIIDYLRQYTWDKVTNNWRHGSSLPLLSQRTSCPPSYCRRSTKSGSGSSWIPISSPSQTSGAPNELRILVNYVGSRVMILLVGRPRSRKS